MVRGSSLHAPLEAFVSRLSLEHSHYPCGYGSADWRITGGSRVDWKGVHRVPGADAVASLSLLALLSQALVGFAVEFESRVPFAMLVGVYLDAAFRRRFVAARRRAAGSDDRRNGKSSLERHGAVEVDRKKRVKLTSVGCRLRDAYRPRVDAVECSLGATAALRAALETLGIHNAGHADHPDVGFVGDNVGFAEVSARR